MKIDDRMYLVGTNFKYSNKGFDNLAKTVANFESVYQLEYLKHSFQVHPDDGMVQEYMNLTYLPSMMKVRNHYTSSGETLKGEELSHMIDKILQESGRPEEVRKWFE